MKFVLFAALLASLSIHAQTASSKSKISKTEMDEAAPFFKAMSECKPKQMKNVDGDMAVEHEVIGLVKDKCKVTSRATIKNKLVSMTSCLLTAKDRKSVKTNGLENYSKIMMDGKSCSMDTGGQQF